MNYLHFDRMSPLFPGALYWAVRLVLPGPQWIPPRLRNLALSLLVVPTQRNIPVQLDNQGEVPRSGGGKATSGAGAKRKEGVQPPGKPVVAVKGNQS